jgi:hypothetical protein
MQKVTIKGNESCQHTMICAGKKKIQTTTCRCTKCGQEEEHTSEV